MSDPVYITATMIKEAQEKHEARFKEPWNKASPLERLAMLHSLANIQRSFANMDVDEKPREERLEKD